MSIERPSRRELLSRTGMAIVAVTSGGIIPNSLAAKSHAKEVSTRLQEPKLPAPTAAELFHLGEYVSYLSNLPADVRVFDVVIPINRLLEILRDSDLPMTRAAARTVGNSRYHYGCGSRPVSEQTKVDFSEEMIPIRQALEEEIKHLTLPAKS